MKLNFSSTADQPRERISSCEKSGLRKARELNIRENKRLACRGWKYHVKSVIYITYVYITNYTFVHSLSLSFMIIFSNFTSRFEDRLFPSALIFINYRSEFLGIEIRRCIPMKTGHFRAFFLLVFFLPAFWINDATVKKSRLYYVVNTARH